MSFWDDLATVANVAVNVVVQMFVPGAPPIPPVFQTQSPPPPPPSIQGAHTVTTAPPTGADRFIVLDLIDCLQKPPPIITPEYVKIVERVSSWVGAGGNASTSTEGARNAWDESLFPEQAQGTSAGPTLIGNDLTSNEAVRNAVSKARNDVLDISAQCAALAPIAAAKGFFPGQNPFTQAMVFNSNRLGFSPVKISDLDVSSIAGGVRTFLNILSTQLNGVALEQISSNDAAQLSSATLSLEGFGGSGNSSVDLGKLTPSQEAIRRQKALDALSVLDFKKRVPKVLFSAFYQPDSEPKGIIVGLKRVPDASGYVITRRSIFHDKQVTYSVTNDDIQRDTIRLKDYVNTWVLSFYDAVQKDSVLSFLDADFDPNEYYYYTVQAYQLQNTDVGSMFTVDTAPAFFSEAQKAEMRRQISLVEPTGPDQVSPYPIVSQQLFGNPDNDWLLAALNVRASINRNEDRSVGRKYAYLSAQLQFLFDQADAGNFVVPKGRDFSPVAKNVQDAISKFGVNQVIQNLLQETGAIYHFDGSEPNDDAIFKKVGVTDPDGSGLLVTVASAIDPETATLNLKTLTSNMPALLTGNVVLPGNRTKKRTAASIKGSKSAEITVPSDVDNPPEINPTVDIQNLQQVANTGATPVDLTTVDGLGTLMRVIRIYSDLGGNRAQVEQANRPPPPKVVVVPAPPPGSNTIQPVPPTFSGDVQKTQQDFQNNLNQTAKDVSQGNIGAATQDVADTVTQGAQDVADTVVQGAKDVANFFGVKL